jgi:hypothetical protein
VSLYPSMDIDLTCAHVHTALSEHYQDPSATQFIDKLVQLLRFVLQTSYVQFDDLLFQQISGIPMGLSCATQLANVYVFHTIKHILLRSPFAAYIQTICGYIDDGFMIWRGTSTQLQQFFAALNGVHPRLQFTHTVHPTSVNFLDVTVFKGPRFHTPQPRLDVAPFSKALNNYLYIPATSAHPPRCLPSFIYAEGLRLVRNSSQPGNTEIAVCQLIRHLRARGYHPTTIRRALSAVHLDQRDQLLQASTRRPPVTVMVTPFNAWSHQLHIPDLLRQHFATWPTRVIVAWCRGTTLHQALNLQWPKPDNTPAVPHVSPPGE